MNYIFSELIPKYEQPMWAKTENEIRDTGNYGSYHWEPVNEIGHSLGVTYSEISLKIYEDINELINIYSEELKSSNTSTYSIDVLHQTPSSVVFEIDKVERGVSGTLKKNSQTKSIEKWLIHNGWVLSLSYSLAAGGDKEKIDLWNQLKNTWEKRFSNISFDSQN